MAILLAAGRIKKIDLHMHSTISDGTDSPEKLKEKAKDVGLDLFSLTDHDSIDGEIRIRPRLYRGDPLFINGVEFSCRDELGKYHILGYCYDWNNSDIQSLAAKTHGFRMQKALGRLESLEAQFGISFPKKETDAFLALDNPGKPHLGNLITKYGYADNKTDAINQYVNKVHVKSGHIKPQEAIFAILAAGGIPVLAHPSFGSGQELITGNDMDERLRHLVSMGLQGVEAYYSRFSPDLQEEMLAFAEKYNLYVTAGSDYHGLNKRVMIGENHLDDVSDGPDGLHRFLYRISDELEKQFSNRIPIIRKR